MESRKLSALCAQLKGNDKAWSPTFYLEINNLVCVGENNEFGISIDDMAAFYAYREKPYRKIPSLHFTLAADPPGNEVWFKVGSTKRLSGLSSTTAKQWLVLACKALKRENPDCNIDIN